MRRALAGLCVLSLLTALAACGRSDAEGSVAERRGRGEVVYNLASEPTTLDPARATRLADLRVIGQCLEGLVRLGEDGRIEPAAAASWEISPDGRTYRFRLRPARWSNGDPVRAGDFAFAWRRVLDPATRAGWVNLFYVIEGAEPFYRASPQERARVRLGVETPDEQTLVVHLVRPTPYFLSLTALEPYSPVHEPTVAQRGEGAFRAPDYVCNGPFRMVEHVPRRRVMLLPNDAYYGRGEVPLNRLVFVMVENEFTEWTAYRRGEIDVTDGVHRSALTTLRARPDFTTAPLVGTEYLCFNCERPPFDRAEVRRAFARALDRRLLVERITRGGELAATGFVPPGVLGRSQGDDFRAEGGDLLPPVGPTDAEAERLRATVAGLADRPVYAFVAGESQRSLAVALQMMWRQTLGVEVAIQSYPARLLSQTKQDGDFVIARASWVADYLDPTTFLDVFRTGSPNNVTRWSDPRYDALLDRAAAADDPAARADLLHQAERMLIDDMPICPLYFYTVAYLKRPGLEGVRRNLLGRIDFRHARWMNHPQR